MKNRKDTRENNPGNTTNEQSINGVSPYIAIGCHCEIHMSVRNEVL